jgi:subtilase family serine protease
MVPDSFPAQRLILLLNRPPEREAALQQFLQAAHTRGSASYHKWLTPEQIGEQFGPADADVQTVTGWLNSHGLQVAKTSKSGQFIEFSGTAGQLREAFHTEIHQYSVNGVTQYANANEIRIPEALALLVGGVSPLNSFYTKPSLQVVGPASYSRSTGKTTPQWTIPNPNGAGNFYAVAPEDIATQYDLGPLYKAGVNGTGQTIGIINESNVDLSLVQDYHNLFGLSSPMPQVIEDGADPGTMSVVDIEAYLDIEEAGAVAPGANVDLYISDASSLADPLYTAALRAVEDNQASVLSLSFQNCEGYFTQAGNALWSGIWEQAAAQGQTVLVSSGDSGSAGCDDANDQWTTSYGLAVNGLASTPWNVAVGGTDFY